MTAPDSCPRVVSSVPVAHKHQTSCSVIAFQLIMNVKELLLELLYPRTHLTIFFSCFIYKTSSPTELPFTVFSVFRSLFCANSGNCCVEKAQEIYEILPGHLVQTIMPRLPSQRPAHVSSS